ncbi:MAG: hypothetical protein NZ951_00285 [Dehalococcoidia bacterium]|nr:hypothetical protein [Dehalococcoidia bacterium]MDW8119083.1 CARDB domain-containing protein [Chloroflexota bacterium]
MRISLLAVLVMLIMLAGCEWLRSPRPPLPSPPLTPGPPTPTPLPTPTPTPVPRPTPNPPMAPPPPLVYDLAIQAPPGWESALIASPFRNARSNTPFLGPEAPFISWWVLNLGPAPLPTPALVDLYLDGILVERWRIPPLGAGERFSVLDWGELLERVRLTPGPHTLTLRIDPTGLLQEASQTNNAVSLSFLWTGPAPARPSTEEHPYLPDLVFFTPPDWSAPVTVSPTMDGRVKVQVALRNRGRSASTVRTVTDLEVNGVVATRWAIPPLLPGQETRLEWDGLLEVLPLRPGVHRVVARADATNRLDEAEEDNNAYFLTFAWPPAQSPPGEGPRLVPYAFPGMADALVLSSQEGHFGHSAVVRGQGVWAHWGVANQGDAPLPGRLHAVLLIDGSPVARWTRPPLGAGEVDVLLDQVLPSSLALLPLGVHQVVLLVGLAADTSGEMGQVLLRVERQVEWLAHPPEPPSVLTSEEVRRRLALITTLLQADGSHGQDGVAMGRDILALASALYMLLYGKPLEAEAVDVLLLPRREFVRWVGMVCADQAAFLPPVQREAYVAACLRLQSAHALTTSWRGRLRIGVMAQRPPAEVVRDLGHELGHFRQMVVNPRLGEAPDTLNLRAVREAQGFLHEALFVRLLEERTGLDLTLYPRTPLYAQWLQDTLSGIHLQRENDEYARGIALLWSALLTDDNLRKARTSLLVEGRLGVADLRGAFLYLVTLTPEHADAYTRRYLARWDALYPTVEGLMQGRLVLGLPIQREGVGAFRSVGLLLP